MPGRAHRTARPRVGLALAGGGPLGGIYEVGALLALAESLGGVESLIEHPSTMSHASMGAELRKKAGITDDIIRISVGIEHIDDLLADLEHALDLSSKSIKQGIHANVFHEEAASI